MSPATAAPPEEAQVQTAEGPGMGPYLIPGKGFTQDMPNSYKKRYRVLNGIHVEPVKGEECDLEKGSGFRVYREGDVFETTIDYDRWDTKFRNISQEGVAANSQVWDANRETLEQFVQRMHKAGLAGLGHVMAQAAAAQQGVVPNAPPGMQDRFDGSHDDTYQGMTEEELKRHAQMEGISLKGCKSREDMIRAIKAREAR